MGTQGAKGAKKKDGQRAKEEEESVRSGYLEEERRHLRCTEEEQPSGKRREKACE